MAREATFDDGREANRGWLWIVLGCLALAALGYGLWSLSNATVGKEKKAPPTTTALLMPPPPPPPPPPPQEKPPEPTEVVKPVPTEVPTPAPEKAPDAAPAAVSIDAASTGAGDAFGLQGGGPGGMGGVGSTGTGRGPAGGTFSDGFYKRNLSSALEDRVQDSDSVNRQVFSADFSVWVDNNGRVTRAEVIRSSGNAKRDEQLIAILTSVADLDAPPPSIRFPARITVRGRRSSI